MKETSFKSHSKANFVKIGNQATSGETNFRHMPHEFRNDMMDNSRRILVKKQEVGEGAVGLQKF